MTEENTNLNPQPTPAQPEIDYDKIASILDGKQKATEESVLKGYFKEQGLTLSLIESRPTGEKNWEYQFFIDIIGHCKDEKVCAALNELEKLTSALRLLGSYPRAKDPTEDEKGA